MADRLLPAVAPQAPDKSPVETVTPGSTGPVKKRTVPVGPKIPNNPETGGGGREGDGH